MRSLASKSMPNLNSIAEWIIAVHGMPALLVPRNFRRIRSPVIFSPVEFFQYRWLKIRRDAKIDVRPFHCARAPLGDLIDLMKNDQLSAVGH